MRPEFALATGSVATGDRALQPTIAATMPNGIHQWRPEEFLMTPPQLQARTSSSRSLFANERLAGELTVLAADARDYRVGKLGGRCVAAEICGGDSLSHRPERRIVDRP